MTPSTTLLPVNSFGAPPQIGGPFTSTFTVRVEKADGSLLGGAEISVDLIAPEGSGALVYLDGDSEHQDDDGNELLFRRLVFEDTSGIATGHFVAGATPGTVTLQASSADPNTGEVDSARIEITVGSGASTGQPALIGFQSVATPLYITGQGQVDVKLFDVQVLDDAGIPVPNSTANNVRLELLPGRPNGGERLTAVGINGDTQEGTIVNTRTLNGVAQATLQTGSLPGTVTIAAIADREDNDVDNGIQNAVTDITTFPISSGQIVSLSFTGPYPGAVAARQNTLDLGVDDFINAANGVYTRLITVVATDEFGNPPPPGQPVTLRLVDSPTSGYPDESRGVFNIGGDDGNPEEGGFTFATETSSLAAANVGCQLYFGAIPPEFNGSVATSRREFRPDQEGSRIITGLSGSQLLSVNTAFNVTADTGFDVPYVVGCAPHFGNVENNPGGVNLLTDDSGIVSTVFNYPINQLGRHFCMAAEANGGKAGALMCHWYLGIATGATLNLIPADDTDFSVLIGQEDPVVKKVTLQLLDGGVPPSPLPAETIAVQIDITDPDKTDRINAELEVAVAEKKLELAEEAVSEAGVTEEQCTNGDVDENGDPIPGDPPDDSSECQVLLELIAARDEAAAALREAEAALAEAEIRDDAYEPQACVVPVGSTTCDDAVSVLRTDGSGIAMGNLLVIDLPPNGLVEFFFSTVGPEVLADTITVTANPTAGDD
ncbi:MAG: hypothetical protein H6970_06300 [Gammaproteobacteria bacterium]|nr:hypothetical protein [Gammaproteobacteria bacterium]MCP5424664.1 hypothetical protein [Gammaproteobacteria bacterium]